MLYRFFDRMRRLIRDVGWRLTLVHGACQILGTTARIRIKTPHAEHPVEVRAGTSDVAVFRQIFSGHEYANLDDLAEVTTVIDCGANVGYSSIYFLNRFPGCTVLAIEPDQANFDQLKVNLAPYTGRVQSRRSAVWTKNVGLKVSAPPIFGRSIVEAWGITVIESSDAEKADIQGTPIPDLLAVVGGERVSILKIDIEGAEVPVFAQDCSDWLRKVDNIVIELHGETAVTTFMQAIRGSEYTVSQSGELTFCRRARERTSA